MCFINRFVMVICLFVAVAGLQAQETHYDFNVPAQSVGQVLNALAAQTGLMPFYTEESAKDVKSAGVQGHYTLQEALDKVLAGTGLEYEFTGDKMISIRKPATEAVTELPTIEVRDETETSYQVREATTTTKTDIPLLETPMSVQVVTREAIDDIAAVSLEDILRNVSGVVSAPYSFYDVIQVRGFNNQASNYRNGLLLNTVAGLEPALVDRIEVAKGPASMLYGRIEPGGVVNLVTRRPQEESAITFNQQFGSFGLARSTLDATGSLTADGGLQYRLIGVYSESESHLDYVQRDNIVGAAYLSWRPNDRFQLDIDFERQRYRFMDTEDIGIPIIGNRAASVPRERYLGDPVNWEIPNEQDRTLLAAKWTYDLNSDWSLTQRIHWEQRDEQQLSFWFAGFDGVDTVDRGIWYNEPDREQLATNLDLTGDLQIAGMRHRVLLGVDWYDFTNNSQAFSNTAPAVLPPISLSNPTYGVSAAGIRALQEDFFFAAEDNWTGIYFQDQISLTENLVILLGGRFDWASTGNSFSSTSFPEAESLLTLNDDDAFTPRAGILYQVSPDVSVYASYTSSFGSNNGRTASGDPIDPEEAEQYELGYKAELLSGAISLTASVFELTKSNVLTSDLSTPEPDDVVAIGEVRNRGFELDINGQITESLDVIASYAYSDAEVTLDNSGIQGNRLRNIPRNAASLWAVYDVSPGAEAGLEFGAGVHAIGEREGDDANSWQMPGYERVDAMLAYRTRVADVPARFQVNVLNLFDKTYIDHGSAYAHYGSPRSVIGSFRVDF